MRIMPRVIGQADERQQFPCCRQPLLLRIAVEFQREGDVVQHVPPGQEPKMLEHHAAIALRLYYRHPVDRDRATGRLQQSGDHAKQRGFAAAGGPEQRDAFAARDGKAHILQRVAKLRACGWRFVLAIATHAEPFRDRVSCDHGLGHLSACRCVLAPNSRARDRPPVRR